jgi:hypothetical protein
MTTKHKCEECFSLFKCEGLCNQDSRFCNCITEIVEFTSTSKPNKKQLVYFCDIFCLREFMCDSESE